MPDREPGMIFPTDLRLVPPDRRIVETFGWWCGAWGALLVELGGWAAVFHKAHSSRARYLFLFAFVAGIALSSWEVVRRGRRTVLALYPELPGWVGIYRRGKLSAPVRLTELRVFDSPLTTLQGTVGFTALAMVFAASSSFPHLRSKRLPFASAGLAFFASAASWYYARERCVEYFLPRKRWPEAFLASKEDAKRLLG